MRTEKVKELKVKEISSEVRTNLQKALKNVRESI